MILKLTPGVEVKKTDVQIKMDKDNLRDTVRHYLPDFAQVVRQAASEAENQPIIMLHQDAFSAGYDRDEYTLLGMAVKYAGLYGVKVMFDGVNGATFEDPTFPIDKKL